MTLLFRSPRTLLILALLAGFALRLPLILCERQTGRDLAEYADIARNIAEGRGFVLGIKAYHAVDTPVVHYGGYDRAPLLPYFLAGTEHAGGIRWGVQWIAPLLYMLSALAVYGLVGRYWGPRAALLSTLLYLTHPGLFERSLRSETEVLLLCLIMAALWARFSLKNAALTGMLLALAFLARPNSAVPAVVIIMSFLGEERRWRRLIAAAAVAATGPVLLVCMNVNHGEPWNLLPQAFLTRLLSFQDRLHYFHAGPLHETTIDLLRENGPAVARKAMKNTFYYARHLAGLQEGLGWLLALIPAALLGMLRRPGRRVARIALLIVVWEFAFYSAFWPSYDEGRFMTLPIALVVVLVPAGLQAWGMERGEVGNAARRALVPVLLTAPVIVASVASDAYRGYVAIREFQTGTPLSNDLEPLWGADGLDEVFARLPVMAVDRGRVIVASNEPWLVNWRTGHAACLIPWDLEPEEWIPFLEKSGAEWVFVHAADWPKANEGNLVRLYEALQRAGWSQVSQTPGLALWRAPADEATQ